VCARDTPAPVTTIELEVGRVGVVSPRDIVPMELLDAPTAACLTGDHRSVVTRAAEGTVAVDGNVNKPWFELPVRRFSNRANRTLA